MPYEDSIGALRDLLDGGKLQMAAVSNADPDQIRLTRRILDGRLAAVQNEFSPAVRSSEPELRLCDELGIAFMPWSPPGGIGRAAELGDLFPAFRQVAEESGSSPQQVTLAWMLGLSPRVIPIPRSSRPETARASAAAADLVLSAEQLDRLGRA